MKSTLSLLILVFMFLGGCTAATDRLRESVESLSDALDFAQEKLVEVRTAADELTVPVIACAEIIGDLPSDSTEPVTLTISHDLAVRIAGGADVARRITTRLDEAQEYVDKARRPIEAVKDALPEPGKGFDWSILLAAVPSVVSAFAGGRREG